MFTQSEENYLKAIFHLQQEVKKGVSTSSLSELLVTKAASVTEMLKRLAEKNLVDYQKYYGVHLTAKGEKQALAIIRKHRLWESFLVERLNFNWDEVHEVAEQLEHIKSPKLVEELDKFLARPDYDPHGDPIPDANGNMPKAPKKRLSQINEGEKAICKGFNDNSSSFLQFLAKHNIGLNTKLKVLQIESFDESMNVLVNQKEILLSKTATDNIYVED
ncbi:metal-dependent transcriptional regulator [Haloflavibacter putidus]|uniref:Transcriptional regulator MntR n=1 Tax=Haloflavibacter putidus TaxID=2576776 RepID=A0A507ZVW0_9FLAO|nr:metal-dependent transcriptional regulator [Haloflavibacter putidus]TQD40603.1 metal-dependent transcriptional regulator [Haloflavibacter putidus]